MTDTHYDVTAPDGAPVVVLGPSLGTTMSLWDPQVPTLARQFRVLRFDHRGHGGTPTPGPGPYAIDDLGRDVIDLLDRLGVERFSYAGVSIGGMIGMWLGAHAAGRGGRAGGCLAPGPHPAPPAGGGGG